jgi:cation diffusion facilitator CzcD-associated flavoprotein CzcO
MPADYPDFPRHTLILDYLNRYVDHFGFRDSIALATAVEHVEPLPGGQFKVTVATRGGEQRTEVYSHVMVANGHHSRPSQPSFPGEFTGEAMHSHDYRTNTLLEGKRVLVVGMGNSGCDIACDVSSVAAGTMLSTRRGAHVIPKYIFGCPLDDVCPTFIWRWCPMWLFRPLFRLCVWLNQGSMSYYGMPTPKHRVLEEHPTISSDLPSKVGHGDIAMRPDVERLEGRMVHYVDGRSDEVDVIIFATGYRIEFPFLDTSVMRTDGNRVRLFQNVVHPTVPGLYFIGLVQPWGSIFPLAEAQAEWVADLVDGKCGLPADNEMQREIDAQAEAMSRQYVTSARHTIQVDFYSYLSTIRRLRRRPGAARR